MRGRLHSAVIRAMKPRSGSASRAAANWFTLIGKGEVALRRWGGFAERLDGAAHTGEGITVIGPLGLAIFDISSGLSGPPLSGLSLGRPTGIIGADGRDSN